jgi:hypothetical protein
MLGPATDWERQRQKRINIVEVPKQSMQPFPPGRIPPGLLPPGTLLMQQQVDNLAKAAASACPAPKRTRDPDSDWERQRQKRINILEVLKSRTAYQAFNSERPRESRDATEPMTPDPTDFPCSKRRWERRFQTFKSRVNEWYGERYGAPEEEKTGAGSSTDGPQEQFHCDDPRHYALSVCCPYAGLRCSCNTNSVSE